MAVRKENKENKENKVMFGMKIISPQGGSITETWFNTELDEVTTTQYWPNGVPKSMETCSINQFINVAKEARNAKS